MFEGLPAGVDVGRATVWVGSAGTGVVATGFGVSPTATVGMGVSVGMGVFVGVGVLVGVLVGVGVWAAALKGRRSGSVSRLVPATPKLMLGASTTTT